MKHRRPKSLGTALMAGLAAMALALAGCTAPGGMENENKAPSAKLEPSQNKGWTGETFTFDGSGSDDPDGDVVQWIFDFGDGTVYTAKRAEDARPTHVYDAGGEYTVTLTVIDDGGEKAGAESDMATKTVALNQRDRIPGVAVFAPPTGGNETVGRHIQPFEVNEDADKLDVTVKFRNTFPASASTVEVRLLDDGDDEVVRQEKTIQGNSAETFQLNERLDSNDEGTWTLEILVKSGGGRVETEAASGEPASSIEIYYDEGY